MKILNLFAGIGGNRSLWGNEHQVTAVEYDAEIAGIYQKLFPGDTVVCGDAYAYLEEHFTEFDLVWASPPCTTHTKLVGIHVGNRYNGTNQHVSIPDMRLYGVILFLKYQFRGDWVVENTQAYHEHLVSPTARIGRHLIWSSKQITPIRKSIKATHLSHFNRIAFDEGLKILEKKMPGSQVIYSDLREMFDKDFKKYAQTINNCVNGEEGKWVLAHFKNVKQKTVFDFR